MIIDEGMLLLPGLGLTLLCLALLLWQSLRLQRLERGFAAREKSLAAVESDLCALLACSRGVGDVLQRQERQIRGLQQRQQQVEVQGPAFREAATLVEHGASPKELVAACGLSQGEAELIAHLNGLKQRKQAA